MNHNTSMIRLTGALSGKTITIPDVNVGPMPDLVAPGLIQDGAAVHEFGAIDPYCGYPDVRSYERKLGLLIPATNTSMEHELWSIIGSNSSLDAHGKSGVLTGIGLHTCNVITPRPQLRTHEDLLEYKRQFLGGLKAAADQAMLAQPQYLIMGMSLEHIIDNLSEVDAPVRELEAHTGLTVATWHEAATAALRKFGAKRIGLLTPFDHNGNRNASRVFTELGFEVVTSVGFSCANALHIAHVPDWAKEKAILQLLATADNKLDAIVQCGTNMSLIQVSEKLEPQIGIPIIGINAATFWFALRENGITAPIKNAGLLLRRF